MENLLGILMDIDPDIDYEYCSDLMDGGVLDSMQILTLVVNIEEEFHISIDPTEITAENFNSVGTIMELIEKHRK